MPRILVEWSELYPYPFISTREEEEKKPGWEDDPEMGWKSRRQEFEERSIELTDEEFKVVLEYRTAWDNLLKMLKSRNRCAVLFKA